MEAERAQRLELGVVGPQILASAVQPHDPRRALERAEHHADAPVLAQVGDRLDPAPEQVDVGEAERAQHAAFDARKEEER